MSQIIANPAEQRKFARFLQELSSFLSRKRARFEESMREAAHICQDARYAKFRHDVEDAMKALAAFETAAERYAGQLDQKGRLGQRFLES